MTSHPDRFCKDPTVVASPQNTLLASDNASNVGEWKAALPNCITEATLYECPQLKITMQRQIRMYLA